MRLPATRTLVPAVVGWAALVALFTAQEYYARHWEGGPLHWRSMLLAQALTWACWVALTPLVVVPLCRRFPVRRPALRPLVLHALAAPAVAAAQTLVVASVVAYWYYGFSPLAARDIFRDRSYMMLGVSALVYGAIVAAVHAYWLAGESERRRRAAAESAARAARAELAALHGRLQPHFLFNAFNGIAELVYADPDRATRMIRALSDLLRRSLEAEASPVTALRDELAFLDRYVGLQEMRFERLRFTSEIAPDALGALVPPLVLQPLVENAIRYTVGARGEGQVALIAERRGDRLRLVVTDDGPGPGAPRGAGHGLAITRERLERLYGGRCSLDLSARAGGGAMAVVDLPFVDRMLVPAAETPA